MRIPAADPFTHVPTDTQVSVFVWSGKGRRPSSTHVCWEDHAKARRAVDSALGRDGTTKVQIAASQVVGTEYREWRIDITNAGLKVRQKHPKPTVIDTEEAALNAAIAAAFAGDLA
ncbi:MAG: hypothetical protein WBA46_01275 [Thermomicrobiales bacterium]